MNRWARRLAGAALALGVTVAIAALSQVPYTAADADSALIRLSWRAPGATVEECRRLSAEERERLPVHMRRDEVCERRIAPYRLHVRLDGRTVYDELVRAAGARQDRPLYVQRELKVAPGEYRIEVVWVRDDADGATVQRIDDEHAARQQDADGDAGHVAGTAPGGAIPARLTLAADLRLSAGDIALITYDVDRQVLVVHGRGPAGS